MDPVGAIGSALEFTQRTQRGNVESSTRGNHGVVDVNARGSDGRTALHAAVWGRNNAAVESLLRNGADVNAKDEDGQTALMFAAIRGNEHTLDLLLESKADIDSQNNSGDTALIIATHRGNFHYVRTLLQYGALRSPKTSGGETAQDIAYRNIGRHPKVLKLFSEVPNATATKETLYDTRQFPPPYATAEKGAIEQGQLPVLTTFWWAIKSTNDYYSHRIWRKKRPDICSVFDFSAPPKTLDPKAEAVIQQVSQALEGVNLAESSSSDSSTSPTLSPTLSPTPSPNPGHSYPDPDPDPGPSRDLDPDPTPDPDPNPDSDTENRRRGVWIHVRSNNILWVKWIIMHLPASYEMSRSTNLICIIDEALEEVRQSSNRRQAHHTVKDDVVSAVLPYFTAESGAFLESRGRHIRGEHEPDPNFRALWKLVDDYGPESEIAEQKCTLQIPQTLDQSYSMANQSTEKQDHDQVIYRWTKGQTPDHNGEQAKLLMVNQVWLWKVKNLVVTASSEPWTEAEGAPLFDKLASLWCDNREGDLDSFVWQVLRQCINTSDEPVYRGLRELETWASMFAKSIADRHQIETARYTDFSGYIRHTSRRWSLKTAKSKAERKREFMALYDISLETEELRQAKDIRDELKMIGRVFGNQEPVFQDWRRMNEDPRDYSGRTKKGYPDFIEKRECLKKLDEEAERVEKRIVRLLDLKQKQGSLIFAADADKRDRENEKQSQLLFVFTAITVVFTPLNFIAALFAVPTDKYPHPGKGDAVSWKLWQSSVAMGTIESYRCLASYLH
ncbi:hypothetical protein BU16DRAFT_522579 [Lophium mytilinum]|uniref:Uncharacterized protein n=1 Tax=Lophium mytilinum TaxID=390894 RepID=A0A6A6RA05_9PEZI|nr:hypothetical protein BU16DRAFT_522579 [Lophium mytilinum]